MREQNEAIVDSVPHLDELLAGWAGALGSDALAYRNHVYRIVNFCFSLRPCTEEERQKIVFLEDDETFSPVYGATILAGDYSAQYDLQKILRLLTPGQMEAERLPDVNPKCIDAANEGLR